MIPYVVKIIVPDYKGQSDSSVQTYISKTLTDVRVNLIMMCGEYITNNGYCGEQDVLTFLTRINTQPIPWDAEIFYDGKWNDVCQLWPDFYTAVELDFEDSFQKCTK